MKAELKMKSDWWCKMHINALSSNWIIFNCLVFFAVLYYFDGNECGGVGGGVCCSLWSVSECITLAVNCRDIEKDLTMN